MSRLTHPHWRWRSPPWRSAIRHARVLQDRTHLRHAAGSRFLRLRYPEAKRRWLIGGEGWQVEAYEPAFAVNAVERSRFRFQGGPLITNDTVYLEILPEQRLVFAYTMTIDGATMSSSLVTVQFEQAGTGTRLVFTEQGAYVDGFDDVAGREQGTRELLEALEKELKSHATV